MRLISALRSSLRKTPRRPTAFRPVSEGLEERLALSTAAAAHVATAAIPRKVHADARRDPSAVGSWTPPKLFRPPGTPSSTQYVAIDVSVLPNGKVIAWGHDYNAFLRTHQAAEGTPNVMVWDPQTNTYEKHNTDWINLFCGGHAFLSDGRLVVAGGHGPAAMPMGGLEVAFGHNKVAAFDYRTGAWSQLPSMKAGRYYPTVISLADGGILAVSGDDQYGRPNTVPEVYHDGKGWTELTGARMTRSAQWYPNLYQLSNGLVFGGVPGPYSFFMDTTGNGRFWNGPRMSLKRFEGTSVMYAPDKILAIGGNAGSFNTNTTETIDLGQPNARWHKGASMKYAREYGNATILPDGTVLETGGTTSASNALAGAVKPAELWDPKTGRWSTMASLTTPRLYHSTAVLLPDGRVLVAGGGQPESTGEPKGTVHQDMQIYSPPYLFKGARPVITSAFDSADYGSTAIVTTPDASSIARVTLVKLGSVTHSTNMTQRIVEVPFDRADDQTLALHIESNANVEPPGDYMLFLLNAQGVPSVSKIVHVGPT